MATDLSFYNCWSTDLHNGVHKLVGTAGVAGTHTLGIALSNTEPSLTHTVRANINELAAVGGYSALNLVNTGTVVDGVFRLTAPDPALWTSTGGFGGSECRYVVLFNDTPAGDPLIGFWQESLSSMGTAGSTWQLTWANGLIFASAPRGYLP